MRTSLSSLRYLKWIFPSQVKTWICCRPASSPISRIAVILAVSPCSICPLGIVQRFLESWINKISISLPSGVIRKTIPPEVGSRTISWIAGFRWKVPRWILELDDSSNFSGRASGTLRVCLLVGADFRVGVLRFFGLVILIFFLFS